MLQVAPAGSSNFNVINLSCSPCLFERQNRKTSFASQESVIYDPRSLRLSCPPLLTTFNGPFALPIVDRSRSQACPRSQCATAATSASEHCIECCVEQIYCPSSVLPFLP